MMLQFSPKCQPYCCIQARASNPAWAPQRDPAIRSLPDARWADMLKAFAACIHYQVATPPEWPQATTAAKQTYNQALAVSSAGCELDGAGGQLLLCRATCSAALGQVAMATD